MQTESHDNTAPAPEQPASPSAENGEAPPLDDGPKDGQTDEGQPEDADQIKNDDPPAEQDPLWNSQPVEQMGMDMNARSGYGGGWNNGFNPMFPFPMGNQAIPQNMPQEGWNGYQMGMSLSFISPFYYLNTH